MLIKKICLISLLFIISSCNNGRDDLKTSSNNKIFDNKNFQNSKRQPLYNQKYITIAKQNIKNDDLDEDSDVDLEEGHINPVLRNKRIYIKMLNKDGETTPSQTKDKKKISDENKKNEEKIAKLEKELAETKSLVKKQSLQANIVKKVAINNKPQNKLESPVKNDKTQVKKETISLKKKFLTSDEDDVKIDSTVQNDEIKKIDQSNESSSLEL
jgi:hypothetical protein